ncbi:LysR family transcriptional regulator [Marinimicrococcus flavescens]|uniref:LysR substrate-binding domain-containing protein n=1 Tax=Marinimicrococcus flavescens TaxID=3031815 RepID=A0AAP3XRY9_9PROT|nr:LysR substrate-binding domain-containing protein [Marinimicrococcus flavescens]
MPMDSEELAVLVHAAAAGSLSEAARRMGTTPAAASRRLAALERQVGARLMQRTTRNLTLTAEGEAFLPHARAALEAMEAGQAALLPGREEASGPLRVTASMNFGRKIVAPLMPRLLAEHPRLRVDLQLTDSLVDIVAEGIDLAVRIARLRDSALVAQKLAPNPRLLCASPGYLTAHGTPRTVAELAGHECLVLGGAPYWTYELDGQMRQIRVGSRFTSNSIEALRQACLGGLGLSLFSAWDIAEELEAGRLVPVELDALPPQELTVWAVYPSASQVPRKVRVFIAMLREALQDCPFRPAPAGAGASCGGR